MTTADLVRDALVSYGIRQEAAYRYRCKSSPLRQNSDSNAFVLFVESDGEHGGYFDHVSNDKGSLYDLARILGVSTPYAKEDASFPTTKRTYISGAEYAEAHGAPWAAFEAWGWRECHHNGRLALEIPTHTGARYRYLDGGDRHYDSPPQYKRCWYGLDKAIEVACTRKQPLVYCNGEASAVVAGWFGVAAFTVAGGGEKRIPADLLEVLHYAYKGDMIVALDCDDTGRKASREIVAQLSHAGYTAWAVDLAGWDKYDLADHCKLYQQDSAAMLASLNELTDEVLDPLPSQMSVALKSTSVDASHAAQWFATRYNETWAYNETSDQWYRWCGTHYEAQTAKDPTALTSQLLESVHAVGLRASKRMVDDTRLFARSLLPQIAAQRSGLINFKNGTFDVSTMELHPHAQADNLTYVLPFDYSCPPCPTIDSFLTQTIPDPVGRQAYMAHIGLALLGDMQLHKAVLLIGPSRSGKSTALMLANAVCGNSEPAANAGPELFSPELEGMRSRAAWSTQRIVTIEELPSEALRNEEIFKAMTAHGGTPMRRMHVLESTNNKWKPKILMATNEAPRYRDRSGALTQRLIIVRCPNSRQEPKQDINLFGSLIPELGAFAAVCIDVALACLGLGRYQQSEAMMGELAVIETNGDALKLFVADKCILDPEAWVPSSQLYGAFTGYCQDMGLKAMSCPHLTAALHEGYKNIQPRSRRHGGSNKVRGVTGIRLRTNSDPNFVETGTVGTILEQQDELTVPRETASRAAVDVGMGYDGYSENGIQIDREDRLSVPRNESVQKEIGNGDCQVVCVTGAAIHIKRRTGLRTEWPVGSRCTPSYARASSISA